MSSFKYTRFDNDSTSGEERGSWEGLDRTSSGRSNNAKSTLTSSMPSTSSSSLEEKRRRESQAEWFRRLDEGQGARYTLNNTIPTKEIIYALTLLICGVLVIVFAVMLLIGYIETEHWDRAYPMLVVGLLLFTPGFYISRIAYYAWKKQPGYSYADIPTYD